MDGSQTDRTRPAAFGRQRRHLGGARRRRLAVLRRPLRRHLVDVADSVQALARQRRDLVGRVGPLARRGRHGPRPARSSSITAITCCRSITRPATIPSRSAPTARRCFSVSIPPRRPGPRPDRSGRPRGTFSRRWCSSTTTIWSPTAAAEATTTPRRSATSSAPNPTTAA